MKTRNLLFVMISVVFVLCVMTPTASSAPKPPDPQDQRALDRFRNALDRDGFDVGIGRAGYDGLGTGVLQRKSR